MLNLKAKVEQALIDDPDSRNSDTRLTNYIWINHFEKRLFKNGKDKWSVALLDIYELPKESDVKRIRAWFNSKGKYLPTDRKVAKQRRLNEEEWRRELGLENKWPIKLS